MARRNSVPIEGPWKGHSVRVDNDLWDAAGALAKALETDVSTLIREALRARIVAAGEDPVVWAVVGQNNSAQRVLRQVAIETRVAEVTSEMQQDTAR